MPVYTIPHETTYAPPSGEEQVVGSWAVSAEPQIAAVCVGHAAIVALEDAAAGTVLDAVGATQSGQKVTEMLPIMLVTV